ncbi:MAG TPA: aminoacyl-histidine dipeptidase [Longimicrobiales bacterium]|nr:aminoacyl-histidine dipeptidase [Longimicrobiales bacterium]
MPTFVSTLEPTALWAHFDHILTIPRGSGNEDAMRAYVLEVAERTGLEHQVDDVGNVVVRKPGAPGHESAPVTVLQSHLDMVNEKNSDTEHDFTRDPLVPERDGEYLKARGTTLGSDNGIGVAAMLALMEADDVGHGPLELLFTIDEETGLTGAGKLDGSMLRGRRLLNLDTEEEGAIYVGCAGGGDSHLSLPVKRAAPPQGARPFRIALRGLKGGHSGVDIHLQRGNAIRLLARLLDTAARGTTFRLAAFDGGDKHNAIPREATAAVLVADADVEGFRQRLEAELERVQDAFAPAEPGLAMTAEEAQSPADALDEGSSRKALHLLHALPHGVAAMSYDIPDLVETSTNLARVRTEGDRLTILMSTRSSVAGELEALRARIRAIAHLAGAEVKEEAPYPGWKPNLESALLEVVTDVYHDELEEEPAIKAIHAGLETGIIGEKVPGMDMVSIGPQIEFPHSPDERVRIPSVGDFYALLVRTLERLA